MCSFINVTGTLGSSFKFVYHQLYNDKHMMIYKLVSRHVSNTCFNCVRCYSNFRKPILYIFDLCFGGR